MENYQFTLTLAKFCKLLQTDYRKAKYNAWQQDIGYFERLCKRNNYKLISFKKGKRNYEITIEPLIILTKTEFESMINPSKKLVSRIELKTNAINLKNNFPYTTDGYLYFKITKDSILFQIDKKEFTDYWTKEINYQKYRKNFLKYDINFDKFFSLKRQEYCFKIPAHLAPAFLYDFKQVLENAPYDEIVQFSQILAWK